MRNHTLFCLHGVFYRLLLLTLDGAVLQALLIECGFSEEKTGYFFSVMKILQVAAILLLSRAADRATHVKRDTALLFIGTVPLTLLLLSLSFMPSLLSGGGVPLLYATGAIYCVVIGAYNILSYKLPYAVMDMRDYGRLSGLSSALGGGASLLVSLLLTALTGAIGYFTAMRGAYIATLAFAALAVLVTVVFLLAKGAHRFYAEYGFGVESLPVAGLGLAIAALAMIKKATKFKLVIALGIVGILLAVASFIFCGYVWLVVAVSVGLQDGFNNAGNGAIMPIVMSLMC